MKNILVLCCLFLMAVMTVNAQNTCTYTVQMHDSYGDGWNGAAALAVLQGSQQVQNFTMQSGANKTATFTVTDGQAYSLRWTKGSYDDEISFEVLDAMGSIVFSTADASALGAGIYEGQTTIVSTFTAICSGCFPVTATLVTVDDQTATIHWPSASSNEYQVCIAMSNTVPDTANPTLVSDTFYTFINLNASTEYTAYYRVVCDAATNSYSPWRSLNINTLGDIAQMPYACSFEDSTENAQWMFINGSNTNAWYIGNAVNNGGNASLYISDDGGLTNHYNPDEYVENAVWAYRDINFGQDAAEYVLSFDFMGVAEFSYDYVKVFVGSPREPNGSGTPAEATLLAVLSGESEWGTHTYTINGSHTGVQRLYFLWYNDHISGEQPPAAIDNITIEGVNCGAPYDLAVDTTTSNSITIHFTPASSDNTSWEAAIALAGQDINDAQVVALDATTYTFTGLSSSSCYRIRVRTNCEEENSTWSNTIEGRTDCGTVTALPFSENFNTNFGINDTNFMPCWTRINNYGEVQRPQISDGSLYFCAGPGTHNFAITPEFAPSIQVRNLVATFNYKGYYVSDQLIIGVMSDPTDTTTFVPVDTVVVDLSNPEQFVQKIVYFNNYTGNGHYVAFMNKYNTRVTSSYIDNLVIDQVGTCARPANVTVTGIMDNMVNVDWTTYSDESNWNVMVVPAGEDMANGTMVQADVHPYELGGLEANTEYDIYVQADCGNGSLSEWSLSTTFRTACEVLTTFPYVEDFESYQAHQRPDCWSFPIPYGENPVVMGTEAYSGTKSLRMGATNGILTTAVTPCIGEDLHQMRVKFRMKLETIGASGTIEVGVMSDPSIPSTFEPVHLIQYPSTDWTEYVVNLNNTTLTGTNRYVAFRQISIYTNAYIYLDNVELTLLSSCDMPEDLTVSNLTNSSAEISWTNGVENQWETYVYADNEIPDFIQTDVVSSNSYSLSNLDANTLYHFYVRTVCSNGEGYSDWAHVDFMTLDSYAATTPYFCDFSDPNENTEWRFVSGYGPNQWYIDQPTGMVEPMLFISQDGENADYNVNSASTAWAYRDVEFGVGAEFELSFKWKGVGEYQLDFMKVYVGDPTQPFNGSMSVPTGAAQIGDFFHNASTWQRFTHLFDASCSGTTKRIFFMWHNDFADGTNPAMMIDSIQITVSDCGKPTNLTASNVAATQAVVNFTPATTAGSQWQYVVCQTGTSPNAQTPVDAYNASITIMGLTPATTYDVYVRTVCLDGGYSSWSNKVTFTTECVTIDALPYTENFDTYSADYPTCWSRVSTHENGTFPQLSSINYSTPKSLYFVADSSKITIATTPEFGTSILMNTLQVEFKYRSANAANKMVVGVMTNPENANTFVAIDTVTAASTGWTNAVVYLSAYTGTGKYIAFKMGSDANNYGYIDNVVVSEAPDCLPVSNVSAANVTSNSATITWTPAGTASSWVVEYGPTGFVPGQGTSVAANINSCILNGLTPVTTYDVYVKSMCSTTSESPWSYVYTFTTECETYTLPFAENFDALTEGIPTCWSNEEGSTANEGYRWNYYAEGHNGVGMRFNSYYNPTNATNLLTTPVITLPANAHPFMTFWCKNPTGGEFNVLISTDNGETFNTTLMTGLTGLTTWEERMINLTNYAGQEVMIAFSGKSNYGSGDAYLYLDEVSIFDSIMPVPPCDAPTNLTVTDKTENSAVLNWNQSDASVNAWVVSYKKSADNNWTNVNVSSKPYTLNGLEYNTEYNVKVAASCDGTISDYTTVVTFKTAGEGVSDYDMNSVNVYPNPTSGQLTIDNSGMMINRVEVYDVYGKLLNMVEVNDVQTTMNVSNYAAGTYFVRIYTEGGMTTKRIVKR